MLKNEPEKISLAILEKSIVAALSTLLMTIFSGFFWGIPFKVVWNAFLIQVVPVTAISYWQAICGVLIFKLLTSPFKRG